MKKILPKKQTLLTAREKEDVLRKLEVTAKELAVTEKEREDVRRKLEVVAKEKESIRKKLAFSEKKLKLKAIEQKKNEINLRKSEVSYRRLFETAHDGILILNSKTGQITDVNPFLEKLLGYSKEEFLHKKLWEVGAFINIKASKNAFKILQMLGNIRYENLPLETKNGQIIDVEFVSNSYIAGDSLVIQCNIRDITERKRLDLIKETQRLFEEERSKVESIADATHELRTPIAIIKGNVDLALLHKRKNPKAALSALRAIDYEIKHLTGILSDLSMITSKAWEMKNRIIYEDIALKSLIKVVTERSQALAYKKNISIVSRKIPDCIIFGDLGYLQKMLINLIRNSIIYGNKDGHTILSADVNEGFVTIHVIDDGIGITDEDMPHVFERFYRADKFHRSGGNSIGLGLAIVQWIAETHGGTVGVKHREDKKGSVFSVTLPTKIASH